MVGIAAVHLRRHSTPLTGQATRFGWFAVPVVRQVPGALEIPLALQWLAQSGRFDALVALGCVIRGETHHFDIVANESARGVMDVALEFAGQAARGG